MTPSSDNPLKSQIQNKIRFLEDQLVSLEHYLPETYQYLMVEMDSQQVLLKQLEVQDHFATIDSSDGALSPCDALESN